MALYFVGMSDDKVKSQLATMRTRPTANLSKPFDPDFAGQLADAFTKAIADRRNEIQAMTSIRTKH
jgi:hypothetical protein